MPQKTKIIATIGPASSAPTTVKKLIQAGANIFRLNFSHGDHAQHEAFIKTIRESAKDLDKHVAILGDLCGPKIRIGHFPDGQVTIKNRQRFTLYEDPDVKGSEQGVGTTYPYLSNDLKPGAQVLLDDGNFSLTVESVEPGAVHCIVHDSGILKSRKGMNMPDSQLSVPSITEKDKADLAFMLKHDVDFVALSFVRKAQDILDLRKLTGDSTIRIIAKIEKPEAIEELESILDVTDAIMIARGDLGVEVDLTRVPQLQKHILLRCYRRGVPVITATQMLESMIENSRPTRAETTDVFNAIVDESDAVMLSGETAAGKYPVKAVKFMSAIAREAEKLAGSEDTWTNFLPEVENSIEEIVSHSACTAAVDSGAKAIVAYTNTGATARYISKYHPPVPVIALTPNEDTCRKLTLSWGVKSLITPCYLRATTMFEDASTILKEHGIAKPGDIIVIVTGVPLGSMHSANSMKLQIVE